MGSYSVAQYVTCLMGWPLYCSAPYAGVWRERSYGDGSTSYAWLSSIAFLPWLPGFPPQAFPTTVSSFTSPWSILCHQQQHLSWDCSAIPKLQFSVTAPSRGPAFLSRICMAAAMAVWLSFYLGCHRSAVSLAALNVSPLTQTIAPMWELDSYFSSPTCRGQGQCY